MAYGVFFDSSSNYTATAAILGWWTTGVIVQAEDSGAIKRK
jgi:hypothetical protein